MGELCNRECEKSGQLTRQPPAYRGPTKYDESLQAMENEYVFPSKIGTWWEQNCQMVGLLGHAGVRRHSNQGNH